MTTGLIITLAGLLMIVTRGPLIWNPGGWRTKLLTLLDTDAKFRRLGLFMALVSVICYVLTMNDPTMPGQLVRWFSAAIFVLTAVWAVFPGPLRTLAVSIWNMFSETVLRVLGVLAVLIGAWLVYFGGTLVGAALA